MLTDLIDVSIKTMIGNLPEILNTNNETISNEFSKLARYVQGEPTTLLLDVSAVNASIGFGTFKNLSVDGVIINPQTLKTLDASMKSLQETVNNTYVSTSSLYSASRSKNANARLAAASSATTDEEYDMTAFFSTTIKGSLSGITINELYNKVLYRTVNEIKVPVMVGSMVIDGKLRMIIYHDHINIEKENKVIERVFVAVNNSTDGKSVVQYSAADTIVISK